MLIKKINRLDKKGQAIFEFLVFIPFIVIMLQVFINVGGAINGSINQQKVLRGYFYYTLKGNPFYPHLDDLNRSAGSFQTMSFLAMGWANELEGGQFPVAPCYILESFFGDPIDSCKNLEKRDESLSQFIRVYTMYGLCGPSYSLENNTWLYRPDLSPNCLTR